MKNSISRKTTRIKEPLCRKKTITAKVQDKVSKLIVSFLVKTPITPNQITIFRFIGLIPLSVFFLSQGNYILSLIGISLYITNNILDYVDGDLARAKKMSSCVGDWLEHLIDSLGANFLFLGIILGSYKILNNPLVFVIGIIDIIILNLSSVASHQLDIEHQENIVRSILKSERDKIILSIIMAENQTLKIIFYSSFLIFFGVILKQIYIVLYVIAVTSTIRSIALWYTLYKWYKVKDK